MRGMGLAAVAGSALVPLIDRSFVVGGPSRAVARAPASMSPEAASLAMAEPEEEGRSGARSAAVAAASALAFHLRWGVTPLAWHKTPSSVYACVMRISDAHTHTYTYTHLWNAVVMHVRRIFHSLPFHSAPTPLHFGRFPEPRPDLCGMPSTKGPGHLGRWIFPKRSARKSEKKAAAAGGCGGCGVSASGSFSSTGSSFLGSTMAGSVTAAPRLVALWNWDSAPGSRPTRRRQICFRAFLAEEIFGIWASGLPRLGSLQATCPND